MVTFFYKILSEIVYYFLLLFFYLNTFMGRWSQAKSFSHRICFFTPKNRECADDLFKRFSKPNHRGKLSQLGREFNISKRTVSNWFKQYQIDPNWRPYITENRLLAHHIFTDEEESNMVEFIKENFIKPGNLFTDAQFRELAMSTFFSNIKMKNKSPILWYPIILYMILKKEIIFLQD